MYWIVTDSTIDMPKDWVDAQENFRVLCMSYRMDGEERVPDGTDEDSRAIYQALRGGKVITTAQINSESWRSCFEALLREGNDVLAVIFSSGLSGTYQAAATAAEELRPRYPERRLEVIDSLCASAGEGLLVSCALQNRAAGMSLTDNARWVREHTQHVVHWFTVDDLMFLRRGGRVSATSAYLGTMIRIKPILHVDGKGCLIPRAKVQGRKKSLRALAEKLKENIVEPEKQTVLISHGDCEEDARALAGMIRELCPVRNIRLSYIGPIIGAHSGPGTVAVFFLGSGTR